MRQILWFVDQKGSLVECALVESDHVRIRKSEFEQNLVVESEPYVNFSFDHEQNLVDLLMLAKDSCLGLELDSFQPLKNSDHEWAVIVIYPSVVRMLYELGISWELKKLLELLKERRV
jgi:hypothetical protein